MANLMELSIAITADDQASSKIDSISTATIAKGAAIGNLASAAIQKGVDAAVGFGKSSIQAGMDFDSAMSQVAATMGVTTDDIADLRQCAQEMGATTAFSATEAADALNYMALAGYDSETAMSMLPNVLNLAAAGGMDLATASDMITDSQTALGLSLEETNELVDQMAKASSRSNTSVDQLGEAILTVGGTAKNMAGGMDEMNTVLGLMADNGIKGSEAGTHLRNMILSLSAPTDTAAQAMQELGVSATDAEGNMRPLEDIMGDFNDAFADMTAEEKTQALSKIFNKTDLASVNALLDTSTQRWDELGAEIMDSAGAAQEMADTQLDNLSGDLTLLKSATEGVQIALSDMATPALRDFAQTGNAGLTEMAQKLQAGDITGAFNTMGQTVASLAGQFLQQLPAMVNAGSQMLIGLVQGFTQNIPQIVGAVTGVATALLENLPLLVTAGIELITGLLQAIGEALPTFIPTIVESAMTLIQGILDNIGTLLPLLIEAALQIVMGLMQGLVEAIPVLLEAIPQIIESLTTALLNSIDAIVNAGVQLITALVQNLPAIISAIVAALPQIISALVTFFTTSLPQLIQAGITLLTALIKSMPTILSTICAALPQIISSVVSTLTSHIGELIQCGVDILIALVDNMPTILSTVCAAMPEIISSLVDALLDHIDEIIDCGVQLLIALVENIPEIITRIVPKLPELVEGIAQGVVDLVPKMASAGADLLWGLAKGIGDAVGGVIDNILNSVGGIVDQVKSFFGIASPSKVFAEMGDYLMQGLGKGIEDNVDLPLGAMEDAVAAVNGAASVEANVTAAGGSAGASRDFTFNVTVNNDGEARDAGRTIGEALYEQMQRMELNYA